MENKIDSKVFGAVEASTQDNIVVLVFGDANTGWQYTAIKPVLLPDGSINEV